MAWQEALGECRALADRELPRVLRGLEPEALREAALHYPGAGGKRLRPAVAMLACEACGGKREAALHAGMAVELVHTFSLVHDDLMDRDATRRGRPSVHVKFGEPTAILAGDALFAKAFEALDLAPARAEVKVAMLRELARATLDLCAGQQRDMELERSDAATPEDYFAMIDLKTARLYEAAARLGALAAEAPQASVEALGAYGRLLGRAFQVRDDVLDLVGDEATRGKPWGSDVRRGKRTIPLLLARQRASGAQAEALERAVGNPEASREEVSAVVELVRATGALGEAQRLARVAAEEAVRALEALPPGGAREALEGLARFSAERER